MKVFLSILVMISYSVSATEESCSYPSSTEGEYTTNEACAVFESGEVAFAPTVIKDLSYDDDGLACVLVHNKTAYYLSSEGRIQQTVLSDYDCDRFEGGYSRGVVGSEMVFFNKQLQVAIAPGFDTLKPFRYGYAVVCNGPFIEVDDGEHTSISGGKCGLIDSQGKLVFAAEHPIESRRVFQRFIDANNECISPPVVKETAAECHAKRHLTYLGSKPTVAKEVKPKRKGDVWEIAILDIEGERLTMELNALDAGLIMLATASQ